MFRIERRVALARRSFLSRLGAGLTASGAMFAAAASPARAQSAATGSWQPSRHAQDDWLGQLPGTHRFVIDATTPEGFGSALLYANNFFLANGTGYGLKDVDLAVVIVARHFATPFVYNDAVWAKRGTALTKITNFTDPKTKQPPSSNLYNVSGYGTTLPNLGTTLDSLLKRGVHLAVCQLATRLFAGVIAESPAGADAVYDELAGSLPSNAHLVSAGIVAVNRAQERGYSFAYGG